VIHNVANLLKKLVGASGFEPETSCAQGSCKKSILLVRLALFCVMVHGFGLILAVLGPKLDPSVSLRSGRRQAGALIRRSLVDGSFATRSGSGDTIVSWAPLHPYV
jgi:hypothetical protein